MVVQGEAEHGVSSEEEEGRRGDKILHVLVRLNFRNGVLSARGYPPKALSQSHSTSTHVAGLR